MAFHDRADAGRQLAALLGEYEQRDDVLVLGLARGGVPVAYEVARALAAPLDVVVVRKLGVPYEHELAMGAIALGGARVLNEDVVRALRIAPATLETVAAGEQYELARRERLYRADHAPFDVHGRTVILVDDGIATGATMRAAIAAVRQQQPKRIVVATPVAAASTCAELCQEVDEVVCVLVPQRLLAIGLWYDQFSQIGDAALSSLLAKAWHANGPAARAAADASGASVGTAADASAAASAQAPARGHRGRRRA